MWDRGGARRGDCAERGRRGRPDWFVPFPNRTWTCGAGPRYEATASVAFPTKSNQENTL